AGVVGHLLAERVRVAAGAVVAAAAAAVGAEHLLGVADPLRRVAGAADLVAILEGDGRLADAAAAAELAEAVAERLQLVHDEVELRVQRPARQAVRVGVPGHVVAAARVPAPTDGPLGDAASRPAA